MSAIVYSTESEEHLVNTGELSQPEWCYITQEEIEQDIIDSWDTYDRIKNLENKDK